MCLNLHPDFIITDCVFHYCFGIIGPGDMHLQITTYRSIQFSLTSKNQWKSILKNVFLFRPQKLSLHLFTILKGKFCGKKNQWNYYWVILLRQFLIHDIFFRSKILLQKTFIAYQANWFFFCFKKVMFSNPRCISIMRMR